MLGGRGERRHMAVKNSRFLDVLPAAMVFISHLMRLDGECIPDPEAK